MSGLALVADRLGARVTGTDRAESSYMERLRAVGLEPELGHDAGAVPEAADVVVSSAVADDNPELERARSRGQRIIHRGELLAELSRLKRLIAVAGAHGKSTTAALIAHGLRETGEDPAFLVGGEVRAPDGSLANAGWGDGEWMVAEADESDGSFLELAPEIAVITNLELDHHSHWSSEAALRDAFGRFAAGAKGLVLPVGLELVAPSDQKGGDGEALVVRVAPPGEDGAAPAIAVTSEDLALTAHGSTLSVRCEAATAKVELPLPGRHNVANALTALGALWLAADRDESRLRSYATTLASFRGVARRLERRGSLNGAEVYDDYAHHPTEVAAALAALRESKPRRLIAAFQPHLYSRTNALARRFGTALAAADEVVVLDVYPAREEPVGLLAGVSGVLVADAAADSSGGRPVWWAPTLDSAERALRRLAADGDVVVTLGAGDVFELGDRLIGDPGVPAAGGSEGVENR